MQKLSLRKQLTIVRLYLKGFSYDEIATSAGVSKGTVANVVATLRAGRILETQETAEQLEVLRELAIELHRCKLTAGQAVIGLAVLAHLQALGVEPADVERWATMCRELAPQEQEAQSFMRVALSLEEARQRTGLSPEALEEKVRGLEEKATRLETLVQKIEERQQEFNDLENRRQGLVDEVSQLEKRQEALHRTVTQKEQREAELSRRVQDLEHRAQAADERLAAARRELQVLAKLGLSPEELPGFVDRLSGIAQRHRIEPGSLRDRLLHELEELDTCLELESSVKMKQEKLDKIEQSIVKAREEREALDSTIEELRQQQAALRASITQEEDHVRKEIRRMARIASDAAVELRQELGKGISKALSEVQKLRDQALELGKEIGQFETIVEANQWLQSLLSLVKGQGGISASDVRLVGLAVLRGVRSWIEQDQAQASQLFWLRTRVNEAIQALEQWQV